MTRSITAFIILLLLGGAAAHAQDADDAQKKTEELQSQVGGLDEAVKELQNDRDALKKFKFSGYIQVNYEKTEKASGLATDPYDAKDIVKDQIRLRRSRVKLAYDGGSTQAVVQGDFSNTGFSLKDAYLEFTEPWLAMFSLRFGVFNRPDYEVEYSSSQRESPERSLVVRTLYPGERDLGAMLTFAPEDLFTLQLAAFNNTYKGTYSQSAPNFGSEPRYFMARLTRSFTLGELGVDLGVHGRFGNARLNTNKVIEADSPSSGSAMVVDSSSYKAGDGVGRNWFGVEAQLYYDFLGGVKLLGEYITGGDVNELAAGGASPARLRDFSGWYLMLVKNLGADFQFAAKVDSYTPNTAVDYEAISAAGELATSTLGLGIHNYTFPNVRLTLYYEMVTTRTNAAFAADPKDNLLTVRAQYKF
jgi:phosphate-selective porin